MERNREALPVLDYARATQSRDWPIFRIVYVTAILHLTIVGGLVILTDVWSGAGLGVLAFASLYMPLPVVLSGERPVLSAVHLVSASLNSIVYGAALGLVVALVRRYGRPTPRRKQVYRWSYVLGFAHIFGTGLLLCLADGLAHWRWVLPKWLFDLLLPNFWAMEQVEELHLSGSLERPLCIALFLLSPCVSLMYGLIVAYLMLRVIPGRARISGTWTESA